jgi:hypothetical protein
LTEEYVLKHKNKPVLLFDLNTENYIPVEILKIYDIQRLPFVLDNETDLKLGVALLSRWVENRGITESRDDYERLMEENHTSSGRELSINSLGLNLTDHYWMHNINQDLNWEKLNFFDNSFNKKNMERIYPSNENAPIILNPNFSVDGCLIKEWVTDGKDRVLLKEGEVGFKQEPYNEVIATNIMNLLNIQNVGYSLRTVGDKIVSACKCMIDRDTELWYARNVLDLDKNPHKHNYQKYIELCTKNGITDVQKKLDEMIVIDFIMGNTDRHTRNFGIIREAETLKWIKIAPIYDCGNSLFYRDPIKNKLEWNIDSFCKWTNLTNMELLKKIETFDWYNETALKKIPKIINAGLKSHDLSDSKKISMIIKIAELRTKALKNIYKIKVKNKNNENTDENK